MRIVVDANILVSLLIKPENRPVLFHPALQLLITQDAWNETERHLIRRIGEIATNPKMSPDLLPALSSGALSALDGLETRIERFSAESSISFEEEARRRIYDPDDVPTVALALALTADDRAIWTEDRHFWGCGIAVWTTEKLRARLVALDQANTR